MKLNYSRGAIPLYLQIFEIMKEKIEREEYGYGALIPSELELEKIYRVSRITVRQAIAELEKNNFVRRARGKGTSVIYVKRIDESLSAIRSFTSEMQERGLTPGTSYIEVKKVKADEEVASHLLATEGSEIYRLYRVRTADDEPIVIFETYLSGEYAFPLDKEQYANSMYDVFEAVGAKIPVRVQEKFLAMLADEEIAERLKVQVGSPIFKRVRVSYNQENRPIEYTISYYRGDRYSYSVELRS